MSRAALLVRRKEGREGSDRRHAIPPQILAKGRRELAEAGRLPGAAGGRNGSHAAAVALAVALALVPAAAPPVYAQEDQAPEPREIVEQTTQAVLDVLRDTDLSAEEKRGRIRDIAYARFDFETISRLVLGRYRDRFSEAQLEGFASEFKRFLALQYGQRVDDYEGERVRVTAQLDRPEGDVMVRSYVVGGSVGRAEVDYRLRRTDGEWRIIDVVAGGRSLIVSYREQIAELFQEGGAERVLERLRERNAELESGAPGESIRGAAPLRKRATLARMAIRSRGLQADP